MPAEANAVGTTTIEGGRMAIAAEAKAIIPAPIEATYPKPSHAWYALSILTLVDPASVRGNRSIRQRQ